MKTSDILKQFHVNEDIGFMLKSPLTHLPVYFKQWQVISFNIPELVKEKRIRELVDKMTLLDNTMLKGFREHHLAFNMLACISSAYIFQDGDEGVPRGIPEQLSKPLHAVSQYMGLKPHVCHPAFVQSNYTLIDTSQPIAYRNMKALICMPGGMKCEEFILCHAQIEIDAGPGIKAVLDGQDKVACDDPNGLIINLLTVIECIQRMHKSLEYLSHTVDVDVFYRDIRPYLSGIGGDKYKYKQGLIFNGVNDNKPMKINGASAAQSCTLQLFDAGLSIVHEGDRGTFLNSMLEHMLPCHREFIEYVRSSPNIRQFVKEKGNITLTATFQQALDSIRDFRTFHIQLVTKFIVLMADRHSKIDTSKSISERGTGGQELMNFLKEVRNDTN